MIDFYQVIGLIFGSGGVFSVITYFLMFRINKKKENAVADQETVTAKKNMADLESEIYARLTQRLTNELDTRDAKIKDLEETQKGLIDTIRVQDGNIKHLQTIVNEYKQTCDECQFRLSKKQIKNGKNNV
jgi:predicted  nucleic acid-binding Zn-ribbon protein